MHIAIGSDHGGYKLKSKLIPYLNKKGHKVKDMGTFSEESCDYPYFAYKVARAVSAKKFKRGVLICKSGIGNSIVANKVKGIRAALCCNSTAAKLSRLHNDANVLVLGARFVNSKKANRMLDVWLTTKFEGGRHLRRLKQIERIKKDV